MTDSQKFAVSASVFLGLWLLGLALPFLGWHFVGIGVASAVGFLVPAIWIMTMPCTCMDGGGLGGSLLAMVQFLSGVIWSVVGIVLLVRAAFLNSGERAGHQAVDVRMKLQALGPGVQHGGEAMDGGARRPLSVASFSLKARDTPVKKRS